MINPKNDKKINTRLRYALASVVTGLSFGLLDGLINGNPLAEEFMEPFKPIAKSTLNVPMGVIIDLFYGFIICGVLWSIKSALPGKSIITKGLTYGLGIWFFRTVMSVMSYWVMFEIPANTLLYILATGLVEMSLLGILVGVTLNNRSHVRKKSLT